ncbi:MAG: type II toxin-antitoxin system RelE/ParE family toxin [Bryobacteraceae bacterium]|nr:type II toxin-antitoxin system RelE/ParE family toxin [Bryobacteraceae bacterium]
MIRSFRCEETRELYGEYESRRFRAIERPARKRLRALDAATGLADLRAIRGNHLEALKGDRDGQYSIRINDRWRLCFRWRDGNAYDVEIVDYH